MITQQNNFFDWDDKDAEITPVSEKREFKIRIPIISMLVCLFAVVGTVAPATNRIVSSCDHALDNTEISADEMLRYCFRTTRETVEVDTEVLLDLSSNAIAAVIRSFLDVGGLIITSFEPMVEYYNTTREPSEWLWSLGLLPKMTMLQETFAGRGVSGMSLYVLPRGNATFNDTLMSFTQLASMPGVSTFVTLNGSKLGAGVISIGYGPFIVQPILYFQRTNRLITGRVEYNNGILKPGRPIWSDIQAIDIYAGMYYSSVISQTASYAIIGEATVGIARIDEFLKNLAESRSETEANLILYTCIASTPIREQFDSQSAMRMIHTLTGVSKGDSYIIVQSNNTEYRGDLIMLQDVNATDPLISAIAQDIGSLETANETGYEVITSRKHGVIRTLGYTIHIKRINTTDGIDWWLVIGEEDTAFETFKEPEQQTRSVIADREKEVDADIELNRLIVIIIVVGLGLLVLIISALVTIRIFAPLVQLQSSMMDVSNMSLDLTRSSLSNTRIQEVFGIQSSFALMVKNLREYRAYVPKAVLDGDSSHALLATPEGDICCVFTDIVRSSDLWERSPEGMLVAMGLHDSIFRACIQKYGGYEVKTIGDAFMVVFENPMDAFAFCHEAQLLLLDEEWPESLLLPTVPVSGSRKYLWNGLMIRMGLHFGPANLEENPLTGRADYRGSTINTAARLESKSAPGTVCCTYSMMESVKSFYGERYSFKNHGHHELKGIGEMELFISTHSSLQQRLHTSAPLIAGTVNPTATTIQVTPQAQKTELLLQNSAVTVATVRLPQVPESLNASVIVICDSIISSGGKVTAVVGQSAYISWTESAHAMRAVQFCFNLYSNNGTKMGLTVGICTSRCIYGNVGNKSQRFNTFFGQSAAITEAAADAAKDLGTFAVYVDHSRNLTLLDTLNAVDDKMRIADVWLIPSIGRAVIYEILCRSSDQDQTTDEPPALEIFSTGSLSDLNASYLRALNEGDSSCLDTLNQYVSTNPNDVVYKLVVTRLSNAVSSGEGREGRITRPLSHLRNDICFSLDREEVLSTDVSDLCLEVELSGA